MSTQACVKYVVFFMVWPPSLLQPPLRQRQVLLVPFFGASSSQASFRQGSLSIRRRDLLVRGAATKRLTRERELPLHEWSRQHNTNQSKGKLHLAWHTCSERKLLQHDFSSQRKFPLHVVPLAKCRFTTNFSSTWDITRYGWLSECKLSSAGFKAPSPV